MESKGEFPYEKIVDLGRQGTIKSISILLDHYINAKNSNARKIYKYAILRTESKKTVCIVIRDRLATITGTTRLRVLKLAVKLNREEFLEDYLFSFNECKKENSNLKIDIDLQTPSLTNYEKNIIQKYILKTGDYSRNLLSVSADYNSDDFLYSVLERFSSGTIDKRILAFASGHLEYLELIQDDLRKRLENQPFLLAELGRFLDPNAFENRKFFCEKRFSLGLYEAIKNNVWDIRDDKAISYPLNAAVCITKNKRIPESIKDDFLKDLDNIIVKIDEITPEKWKRLKRLFIDISSSDYEIAEAKLIEIDKVTRIYSDVALRYLCEIKSKYAFREMSGIILTTEDRSKRFNYSVQLIRSYPEKASTLYGIARDLEDEVLLARITEVASQHPQDRSIHLDVPAEYGVSIINNDLILSDLIAQLCRTIDANTLYSATGFVYRSGLLMMDEAIEYVMNNHGIVEFIVGSLQNYSENARDTKIDKNTVKYINKLCLKRGVNFYTYCESFYHGKFYYISNGKEAYAIIGSSNVSGHNNSGLVHLPPICHNTSKCISSLHSVIAHSI